jgi:hypothetical protein
LEILSPPVPITPTSSLIILIFSTAGDSPTLDVTRWIKPLSNAKVVRINADETYRVDLTFSAA